MNPARHRLVRPGALLVLAALAAFAGCATAPPIQASGATAATRQPEGDARYQAKPGWRYAQQAVAAANPLATQAGLDMLRQGGSAIDAAIAAQMVLTLVEPQSSGIGGGAFLLHFDGRQVEAFDGRETAPAQASPSLFLQPDGKPLAFADAVVGGRSVGVPGAVAMLAQAHAAHGKLPWAALFAPAIALARSGFAISPRMATLLANEKHLPADQAAAAYFYAPDGKPWPAGHILRNPELAAVLEQIAAEGPKALSQGELAQAIVNSVRAHPRNPGGLQLSDLAQYQPLRREALCFEYDPAPTPSPVLRICGMPPPSSGTLAVGAILRKLQQVQAHELPLHEGRPSADWLHLYAQASALAFADRAQFVADPAFTPAPAGRWDSLLDPQYLRERTRQVRTGPLPTGTLPAQPGSPGPTVLAHAPMADQPERGTSHLSVADRFGNVLSMTTTIEDGWGARLLVNRGRGLAGGFLLNNQLTDFSFAPAGAGGKPIANRVEAGKRPRSSMTPLLVFERDTGKPLMSLGSPGGAFIIHYVTKALYGSLHWQLSPQAALDLPNFANLNGPTLLEVGRFAPATVEALRALGHDVRETPLTSGLQMLQIGPGALLGGADPRREGVVLGD